jgi:hypothetical protein
MRKILSTAFLLAASLAFSLVFAQQSVERGIVYANLISEHELEKNVRVLASDGLEGRKTGEKGQKMAAFFIREQFIQAGLQPLIETNLGKTYFQHFELENSHILSFHLADAKGGKVTEVIANPYSDIETAEKITFRFVQDIKTVGTSNAGEAIVWVLDESKKLSDAFWGEEFENINHDLRSKGIRYVFYAVKNTEKFTQAQKMFAGNPHLSGARMRLTGKNKTGIALLGNEGFKKIFGLNIEQAVAKKSEIMVKGSVLAEKKSEVTATENVLGYIPGSEFPDEVIVISAHYDHLGVHKNGQVYKGADDNASGTCGLIEIAKAFGKAKSVGDFPKRSVLFIAYSAEEQGMLGSEYYTDYAPVFPMEKTVVNLNVDMIGREHTDTKFTADNYVSLVGSDWLSPELHEITESVNKNYVGLELDYTYNDKNHPERYFYRSDQYNFAKYDIPVIFYTGPDHADYHQLTDDPDRLLYARAEKVSKLIFLTAWEVANRDNRLKIQPK